MMLGSFKLTGKEVRGRRLETHWNVENQKVKRKSFTLWLIQNLGIY